MATADNTSIVSVFTAVGGLVVTAFGYIGYQKRRDRLAAIRKTFDDVIGSLAGDNEEQRLASAILLRRFFDETSELGLQTWLPPGRKAPYAQEAVSVIAAMLRGLETGNLQKLLADGLAYAPDLKRVDLQRTNLQNAYLSSRKEGVTLEMEKADFYRADLTDASLKDTTVTEGAFYQARLCNTIFKGADLRGANFFQADLTGAKFDGAKLRGASFKEARNVPEELCVFLKDGTYNSDQLGPKQARASAAEPGTSSISHVFLSLPSHRTLEQQLIVEHFTRILEEKGLIAEELPRSEYPQSSQLSEVRRRLMGCSGAAIFGFGQPLGDENPSPPSMTGSPPIQRHLTPTPWNHIEARIAFGLDLPLLVMAFTEFNQGIFDRTVSEQSVNRLPLDSDWSQGPAKTVLSNWTLAVLERASRGS